MMTSTASLPLSSRLLRWYLRTGLRGRTRLAQQVATAYRPLQQVPVPIEPGQTLFLDMRDGMCRDVLRDFPYARHPWEPDEQAVLRGILRAGEVVFDIGAHYGEHSVLMAGLVGRTGRVVAFEPNPERCDALRRTVEQHGNGELVEVALGDAPGTAVLYVPEFHVTASLANWTRGTVGAVREVTCRRETLDRIVLDRHLPQPHFIKCDVEGAELQVFSGARQTLTAANPPMVMYEANQPASEAFGSTLTASTEFLRALDGPNYSFYWVQPGGALVPISPSAFPPGVRLLNLVAVPAVHASRVAARER